ncbi:hypothetical protein BCR44DRAFT_37029 [Catenaria anguillulae PL171]|uniref:Uncharacterized protein n=1 Tax=Catenaria anguillulae PL171 TaxID=765915 RepID=A0A1Y2I2P1_9FUNG|nr:hypothetical protein BCR44DRAFT_37029 [Catenaria anguillulae PL171]
MFPLSRAALHSVASSSPAVSAALTATAASAVVGVTRVGRAALHATAAAPAVATKVTTTTHNAAPGASVASDPAVLDEAWTMAASSILGTGRGLHTSTVSQDFPSNSSLDAEDASTSAAKLRKRAELYSKTEAGTAAWRADTTPSMGISPASNTMSVPDTQHRGVGAIDEGVDGLREAGFLNDHEARELTSDDAVRRHAGLAPPPGSVDGATNVYAVDDQYKEIAFAILENTERDFASSLRPKPEALNPTAHDQTIAASSFAEMSAEVNPNATDDLPTSPESASSHLSPAARMHASTLYATQVSYSWRPNPVPVDQGAPEVAPTSMPSPSSPQLRALSRDPSAFVPGSRRAMHSSATRAQPLALCASNLAAATAVAMSTCMRAGQSNALVTGLPIGARPYTYITGWNEFMEELDQGRPAMHYETLRVALAKSGNLYAAEDMSSLPQSQQQSGAQDPVGC